MDYSDLIDDLKTELRSRIAEKDAIEKLPYQSCLYPSEYGQIMIGMDSEILLNMIEKFEREHKQ